MSRAYKDYMEMVSTHLNPLKDPIVVYDKRLNYMLNTNGYTWSPEDEEKWLEAA